MRRTSESAVALVMTLIMLSVITVVAVAFLALSQRERISVSQSTQQSDAEIMQEAAAERGKADIYSRFIAGGTNLNAVELLVSRNYIRTNGFIVNDPVTPVDPLNVNYEYTTGGQRLPTENDMLQNLANLFYDPRPPVFVNTNVPGAPEVLDFRFYLDLNRNRRFETNGAYPVMDVNGQPDLRNWMNFVGDPEWIGVLEHPEFVHSRTNRFIGRYAYIVLPIGKSLDVNHIHNQGKRLLPPSEISYFRNQGVGSWEINLAAFLADLNTNVWNRAADPYFYETNLLASSSGRAFRDALEIYHTRMTSYQNLAPANQVLNPAGVLDFQNDMIDMYADGLLDAAGNDNDLPTRPWPGSYNWTNFFTINDFYDIFRGNSFRNGLSGLGSANLSYDRYTFYRMLAQFSHDSAPENSRVDMPQLRAKIGASKPGEFVAEPAGKINVNYDNLNYPISDMAPWAPNDFFNTVGNVLLSSVGLSITNIPIYPTNYYGLTVHRMLQMAANIYDSTSSNRFPSVFRPIIGTNVVGGVTNYFIATYYYDDDARTVNAWIPGSHGMPMVIGAKKNIPNFNEYDAQTAVMMARKLELRRNSPTAPRPYQTNEMYVIGISNLFGLEAWNSCTQAMQGPFDMLVANNVTMTLTNSEGLKIVKQERFSTLNTLPSWDGYAYPYIPSKTESRRSLKVPLYTNTIMFSNAIYRPSPLARLDDISRTNFFTVNSGFRTPDWQLSISNNLVYVLSITNRILDFVQLPNLTNEINFNKDLFGNAPGQGYMEPQIVSQCWSTNRSGASPTIFTPTAGINAQIDISAGNPNVSRTYWNTFQNVADVSAATKAFYDFLFTTNNTNTIMQAPFTPTRKMVVSANWEVNDPLVHYIEEHLKDSTNNYTRSFVHPFTGEMATNQTLLYVNNRYSPWRGFPGKQMQPWDNDPNVKDAGITKSDDWDFPTNRFPSIGWLGRVHRGTPWQTVYMKAGVAPANVWNRFSLDPLSHPTNDWRLVDVFTAAIHPNASQGQLSINQTNFAAWSALLSGVIAYSNIITIDPNAVITAGVIPMVIEPTSSQLITIYEGIQKARDKYPDKTFRRLGDLLSVPELTQLSSNPNDPASPFLDRSSTDATYPDYGITDTILERIPQQILSLVKVGDPRYVVYAYGQSLRPAPDSIMTSGSYVGMCTNYQVTGEFVTRTVFQIEGTAGAPRPTVKAFNILSAE